MLRKLGHVTKEGVVTLKGRAACEISTGDELLTTELMFNGVFNSLDKHQLVALISCLVPVEKSNVSLSLPVLSVRVSQLCFTTGKFRTSGLFVIADVHDVFGPGLLLRLPKTS